MPNPTLENVPVPSAGGPRPVAGFDVSGFGRGAEALARSGQVVGKDIQSVASDLAEVHAYQARNSALLAQDQALGDAIQLREKYKHDTDWATLPQRWQGDLNSIMENRLSQIPEGPMRDHARARMQIPFAREAASVSEQAFRSQSNEFRSGLIDEADDLINTAGPNDDPLHNARWQQWGTKVKLAQQQGFLSPVEAETLQRKTARGVMDGEFRAKFRGGRESAANAVLQLEDAQSGDPYRLYHSVVPLGRRSAAGVISAAETGDAKLGVRALGNISPDSNGTRSYGFLGLNSGSGSAASFVRDYGAPFHLTAAPGTADFDAQWKNAAANQTDAFRDAQLKYLNERIASRVSGDLQSYGIPANVAADPRVRVYFTDRAVQMGNLGLANAQEAWSKAGNDPARFLRNMNEIDSRPENLSTHFRSALASGVYSARGNANRLQTRLRGALGTTGAPLGGFTVRPAVEDEEAPTNDPVRDILTPTHRDTLIREGHSILHAYDVDDESQRKELERAAKKASDDQEFKIFSDIASNPDKPNFSMQDIIDMGPTGSGVLSKEAAERMITMRSKIDRPEGDDKKYGPGFWDTYTRIHANDDDPNRLTNPEEVYRLAGPGGSLTMTGAKELVSQMRAEQKPDDVAENAMKRQFLDWAKHEVSGEHGLMKIKDPKGEEIFTKFLPMFFRDYAKGRQDGKSPGELLDTDKGDLAKSLKGMKRPMSEWINDVLEDSPEMAGGALADRGVTTAAPTRFNPANVKSLNELQSAYMAGQISRTDAQQIALDRGWAARRAPEAAPAAAAPAPVAPPISGPPETRPVVPTSR